MKTTSRRKITCIAASCIALAVIIAFFVFGGTVLNVLENKDNQNRVDLGKALFERHGLVLLADFDNPVPCDIVSQTPLSFWDTPRVSGHFGYARRIDFDLQPVIHCPISTFAVKTNEMTFAAWFKPRDFHRRQMLLGHDKFGTKFKLILSQKRLLFSENDSITNLEMSCEYKGKKNAFTHIALVVNKEEVSLWQNGSKTAGIHLDNPILVTSDILPFGVVSHSPFEGDIDDLAIWNRSLSPKEIKSLARSTCDIKRKYEPFLCHTVEITARTKDFLAGVYRSADRLVPPIHTPAQIAKGIPKITIWPTKSDTRHFLFAHEESLVSGYRTSKASTFRSVDISMGDNTAKVKMCLDDVYGRSNTKRMAFIIKDPSHTVLDGCGVVHLYPPELHVALHPDAPYPLPLSGSFVRLFLGDSFKGIYLIERFDRSGSAWMARGARTREYKKALYHISPPAPCDIPSPGTAPHEAFAAAAALSLSDTLFPWSRQETYAKIKALARHRECNKFSTAPDADEILKHIVADNPSPMFITNDLAFDIPNITWESSDQSLVTPDGHVTRPPSGAPKPVLLTPVTDGVRGTPRRIRVVPLAPDIQTLFLHIALPVEKIRRSDFVCYRIPAGGGSPEWLTGIGSTNGGIKHRGNTSYLKGSKRSFSLEFDQEVSWPGSNRKAQHVLLFSGYADPTRLRNKISFDSYRIAASDGIPCGAVGISWVEIFINGEYFGVWETSQRVKDICDPKTCLYKVRSMNPNLWSTISTDMTECINSHDPRSNPYLSLEKLFKFTSSATPAEFAKHVSGTLHLDSIVNYYLMLNFTENYDGQVTNQYIGRGHEDERWFIIPWDYDKTFFKSFSNDLSNNLTIRMFVDFPEFGTMVSKKWGQLRAGPMSDTAVLERIRSDATMLAPYMEEEYRLLKPLGWEDDFPSAVDVLEKVVAGRLKMMDEKINNLVPAKTE